MKNNLFANGLLILIGVLLLLAALQLFGWGRGTQSLEAEVFDASTLSQLEDGAVAADGKVVDDKTLLQITDAPLFSYDRQPFVAVGPEADPDVDVDVDVEPEPLKAKVTSIMITDENRYAMVFDELSKERITLTQGMPLPGDQGLWVVEAINPRTVTFSADGEEPVEIGLEIFAGKLNAKAAKASKKKKNNRKRKSADADKDKKETQKNSAEEIRKKIAERRAQMRANAAKGNKE